MILTLHLFSQSYKQSKGYIIAQAPMESTSRDFWKMVYERECAVVVMLSAVEEEGQVGWMLGSTPYRALGEILTQNLINPSPTNILCWLYGLWFIKLFLMVGEGSK